MSITRPPAEAEFLLRLRDGPAFLMLGQAYLAQQAGSDPFLAEILRKYGAATDARAYAAYLDLVPGDQAEEALAWMDERCRRLSVPPWLSNIAEFSWSGVVSSAIDSIWARAFAAPWRGIQPVLSETYRPANPRNRSFLHCTYLFGCVNRSEEAERAPVTRAEWIKRRQVAVGLLRRLPDLVTPLGTLAIEAYDGSSDWITWDDLFPILDQMTSGQAHVFSTVDTDLQPWVQNLIENGKLTLHRSSLASVLTSGADEGLVELGLRVDQELTRQSVHIGGEVITVPSDLWTRTARSATIVGALDIEEPPHLSPEARYHEFRSFVGRSDGVPDWSSYARGFAFERDFQRLLEGLVRRQLESRTLNDEPIILHGQTGSGKSVALGAVAFNLARSRISPVLYVERRSLQPSHRDIDAFCRWCEDAGAPGCVVCWDGMQAPEDYTDLARFLSGRGRKVVVVGTSYLLTTEEPTDWTVAAPPSLGQAEAQSFSQFLASFHPALSAITDSFRFEGDRSFLVALYRLLPVTRGSIRAGVAREVGFAEELLAKAAAQKAPEYKPRTALALALANAGLIDSGSFFTEEVREVGGELVDGIQDMSGLVMVPGQFGLQVPLELLLRTMGKGNIVNFVELMRQVDVFRWFEDAVGNIEIGPRNSLEARLLVQSRMGGAATEIAFLRRLLLEVQDWDLPSYQQREIDFAVELIGAIGPKSQERARYAPFLREVADTLAQLRRDRSVENPRLLLQEANLLREWMISADRPETKEEDLDRTFDRIEAVLLDALELLGKERAGGHLHEAVSVELATALASRAQRLSSRGDSDGSLMLFQQVREVLLAARSRNPGNYYPVDVLAWATRDAVRSGLLDDVTSAEAIADLLSTFHSVEPEFYAQPQREKYLIRRLEVARWAELSEMGEETFEALRQAGSRAGFFLRALWMSGLQEGPGQVDSGSISDALGYLEENWSEIQYDARCLNLFLDLWWLENAGERLFSGERRALPFNQGQWQECLRVVNQLGMTGEAPRPDMVKFVLGLALFHVGSLVESLGVFEELRNLGTVHGRRRIVRSYLLSNPDGTPQVFQGTVAWFSQESKRGEVFVEGLRHRVPFLANDFPDPHLEKGRSLGSFHIAFNFLGPVADPVRRY